MEQMTYWNSVADTKDFTTNFQDLKFSKYVNSDGLIMDIGCGYGRTLDELHNLGYKNLIGLDFSEKMIERGKKTYPHLDLRIMKNEIIKLDDCSVHGVILFAVLTCIIDDETQKFLIKEIQRVLKPNGIVYVNDFLINEDERNILRYEKYTDKYRNYGIFELPEGAILRHHSESWILELFSGFEKLKFDYTNYKTMNGNDSKGFYYIGRKFSNS